jgi:cysteinyl-tRNA synthetase
MERTRRTWSVLVTVSFGLVILVGCAAGGGGGDGNVNEDINVNDNATGNGNENANGVADKLTLNDVRFWGYQIQSIDNPGAVDQLANSRYDLLVLEPTRTDTESPGFDTRAMVDRLQATPASDGVHRKLVVAYVDIGQAEDWRWYWTWTTESADTQVSADTPLPTDWPDYIVARDPDGWTGNYPVVYWDAAWKDIIIYGQNQAPTADRDYTSAVDEVIRDGFDGIYLDWVEGFENDAVIAAAAADGRDAATEMVNLIGDLRAYARQRDADFVIIQQNASALIDDHPALLDVIDAIAQEGIWFDGSASDDWDELTGYYLTDQTLVNEYLGFLDQYRAAGRPVLDCEYALQDNAAEAYSRSAARGYVPYVTRRSLSQLTDTPPPGLPAD